VARRARARAGGISTDAETIDDELRELLGDD
jgi:hypothetical protein